MSLSEKDCEVLLHELVPQVWPGAHWLLIKAQMAQESGFDPKAKSACGACGLMQIMPATFAEVLPGGDIWVPYDNVRAGIRYLKQQFDHFPEITDESERIKFALASYNGGRGYVNKAVSLARAHGTDWQRWEVVAEYLAVPDCAVNGRHPDFKQITNYVNRITSRYAAYKGGGKEA